MNRFLILLVAVATTFFSILQISIVVLRGLNVNKIESCDYILLGDSHTEYINQDRIYNFSLPGSSFHIHEKFIKSISLQEQKVIINVAPHNFSDQYHNRYFSNNPKNDDWRKRFFIDIPKAIELFRFNKLLPEFSSLKLFGSFAKARAININQEQDLSREKLERTLTKHFGDSTFTDTLEINAFTRIVNHLNKYDIEYAVVQMPHHTSYWSGIPKRILIRYENIVGKIENQIRYNVVDESHYLDGDHILGAYQGSYLNGEILDALFE